MANIRELRDNDGVVYPVTDGAGIVNGTITPDKLSWNTNPEVIGRGTNNQAWKFPDGRLVCMEIVHCEAQVTSAWGSCYTSPNKFIPQNWAVPFVLPPIQSIAINQSSMGSWLDIEEPNSETNKVRPSGFFVVRPNSYSGGSLYVGCIGFGYWK